MKEHWNINKEKLIGLEEGLIRNDETSCVKPVTGTSNSCKQLIQCVKFLLYLELLLFVGWACYTVWQTYRIEAIEGRTRDTIHEAESRISLDQQLTFESSTFVPDENLVKPENKLPETVTINFENRLTNEEYATTTVHAISIIQEAEESGAKRFDTDVTEVVKVDMESAKPERITSDLSKSQEDVLVFQFGLLPFPSIYKIKDRSQFIMTELEETDKSENSETSEKSPEIENTENIETEQIDSSKTVDLFNTALLTLLTGCKLYTDENFSENDDFTMICGNNKVMTSKTLLEFVSEELKEHSDVNEDVINQSVHEKSTETLEKEASNQDPTITITGDFIIPNIEEDFSGPSVVDNWSLDKSEDEEAVHDIVQFLHNPMLFPKKGVSFEEFDHHQLTTHELLSTELLNKRSNPTIMSMDKELTKTEESFDDTLVPLIFKEKLKTDDRSRLRQQIEEALHNRVSNRGISGPGSTSLNDKINGLK